MNGQVGHCNPGVGLKMTGPRIVETNANESIGPGPQQYNTSTKLTEREKAQNELLSKRYMKGGIAFDAGHSKEKRS